MEWVHTPNLPEKDATLVAVSFQNNTIIHALHQRNIDTILILPDPRLPSSISSHADMLIHHLGRNHMAVVKGSMLKDRLEKIDFEVIETDKNISEKYPHDVALNAARVGDFLICNPSALDEKVYWYCEEKKIKMIPVRQGYAKCSVAIVNEFSIITADLGIAQAAEKVGLDVLKISPGYVNLDGYSYGFLGGTCGKIGKNKLAFAGNIQLHPDYFEIQKFCYDRNVEVISLADIPLTDIGGILPLKTC